MDRALRTAASARRVIQEASCEAELVPEFCRIAVEEGGYRLAWVGYAEQDAAKTVRPVAQFGFDAGYLEQLHLTWDDSELGRGPTGRAIRTGLPQVSRDISADPYFAPWRALALRRGFASSASLPLQNGDPALGALTLYAAQSDAFDEEELELLLLLAMDLSHGIQCARGQRRLSRLQEATDREGLLVAASLAAARLAHDMNNCLAVVVPCLEELALKAPAESRATAVDAVKALERATALNQELLHLGRKGPAAPSALSLDEALGELAAELRHALGARVTLELAPGAPAKCTRIDRLDFERIVTNLVLNARDAIVGRGTVEISTGEVQLSYPLPPAHAGASPGVYVFVSVRDTGQGISPEARAHLFEPFYSTKGPRGTGLGLASVYILAHQADGHVVVESEVGHGATFEVWLPVAPATPDVSASPSPSPS